MSGFSWRWLNPTCLEKWLCRQFHWGGLLENSEEHLQFAGGRSFPRCRPSHSECHWLWCFWQPSQAGRDDIVGACVRPLHCRSLSCLCISNQYAGQRWPKWMAGCWDLQRGIASICRCLPDCGVCHFGPWVLTRRQFPSFPHSIVGNIFKHQSPVAPHELSEDCGVWEGVPQIGPLSWSFWWPPRLLASWHVSHCWLHARWRSCLFVETFAKLSWSQLQICVWPQRNEDRVAGSIRSWLF